MKQLYWVSRNYIPGRVVQQYLQYALQTELNVNSAAVRLLYISKNIKAEKMSFPLDD